MNRPNLETPNTESRCGVAKAVRHQNSPNPSPELSELLRTGPFDVALRAAIRESRLSLDRIQHHLRARGTPVSITALSYWQSGRRRPERPDSLLALRQLEHVLAVPQGSLFALVGPPRPRGRNRRSARSTPSSSTLWTEQTRGSELLTKIDTSHDDELTRLSHHDRVHIDAQGYQSTVHTQKLVRAETDGVDRWVVMFDGGSRAENPAVIRPLRSCHLGQVLTDHARDLVVAELLFEHVLNAGETLLMEYEVRNPPTAPRGDPHEFRRVFRLPVRQYLLELCFDPQRTPRQCTSRVSDGREDEPGHPSPMHVDASGRGHVVKLDYGPGVVSASWQPAHTPNQVSVSR
ncbi:hypothetical protein GCM10027174_30340 [Salinifilum aidingensis]